VSAAHYNPVVITLLTDPAVRQKLEHMALPTMLILFTAAMGLGVIVMLLISWRRYNARLNRPRGGQKEAPTDAWQAAADRVKTPDADEDDNGEDDDDEPNNKSSLGR